MIIILFGSSAVFIVAVARSLAYLPILAAL